MDLFILEVLAVIGTHITRPSCVARSSCRSESLKKTTDVLLLLMSLRQTSLSNTLRIGHMYIQSAYLQYQMSQDNSWWAMTLIQVRNGCDII